MIVGDLFTMHMVEWQWLFASIYKITAIMDVLQCKIWPSRYI